MIQFIKQRFWMHFLVGTAAGYLLTYFLTFHAHYSDFPIVVGTLLIAFILWCGGFVWEWLTSTFIGGEWSWDDVLWSAIGGALGASMWYIFGYSQAIVWGCRITIFALLFAEAVRLYKVFKSNRKNK